jgi:hypothetical protein
LTIESGSILLELSLVKENVFNMSRLVNTFEHELGGSHLSHCVSLGVRTCEVEVKHFEKK